MKKSILFVCLGNICRSPAAEGVLCAMAKKEGVEHLLEIDSAGTYGGHRGEMPDYRMRKSALTRGYKLTHRSRQFTKDDFHRFDHIIVMDDNNYNDVINISPKAELIEKVKRFTDLCTKHPNFTYVPDPYYEGQKGFEIVLDLLEDGCGAIIREL